MSAATSSRRVFIVMATYNGVRHLHEQLESIRAQRHRDWTLLVRDDGSTDGTQRLLDAAAAADARITIVRDDDGHLGVRANFSRLAAHALDVGATHVCLADQDDVWYPDRVARSLALMRDTERHVGGATPVLVHSDVALIDAEGRPLQPSFMRFQHIHHELDTPLRTLLVQNFVTGCSVMVNRPLLELALPVPETALMHDWWFALCAAAAGTLAFIPEATLAYRRHGRNAVTVRGFWRTMNPLHASWIELWQRGVRSHGQLVAQTAALRDRLTSRQAGQPRAVALTEAFLDLHRSRRSWTRLLSAARLGLRSQSFPRTATLYLRVASGAGSRRH